MNTLEKETQDQKSYDDKNETLYKNVNPPPDADAANAWHIDTNNRDPLDSKFPPMHGVLNELEYIEPNWNDGLSPNDATKKSQQVVKHLKRNNRITNDNIPAIDKIQLINTLLDYSFSETIKRHIVSLTSTTETVETACDHCFYRYHEQSKIVPGDAMEIWIKLQHLIGHDAIYNAFLIRSYHLEPTSRHFPIHYQALSQHCREQHLMNDSELPHYTATRNQIALLDKTLRKLDQAIMESTDATEISKLSNAIVRATGGIHILSRRLSEDIQALNATPNDAIPAEVVQAIPETQDKEM